MFWRDEERQQMLAEIPLFHECTRRQLAAISRLTTELEEPPGTVLCREGEIGGEFCILVEGEVVVTRGGVEINRLGPGSFFGEMALLDHGRRVATVTAATPVKLLVLNAAEFAALLDTEPRVAVALLKGIAERVRASWGPMPQPAPVGV